MIQKIRFQKKIIIGSVVILAISIVIDYKSFRDRNEEIRMQEKINFELQAEYDKVLAQNDYYRQRIGDLEEELVRVPVTGESLGEFTVTHYCSCPICCGKWADGITASGTTATEGKTIAVDPSVIPLGSQVLIDGQIYIAEDVGGAIKGNKVDIYMDSHQEAINRGKIKREVAIIEQTAY